MYKVLMLVRQSSLHASKGLSGAWIHWFICEILGHVDLSLCFHWPMLVTLLAHERLP